MLIATFGPSTGWLGKTIVFENNIFVLQDHGPISAGDVMRYDQQGHSSGSTMGCAPMSLAAHRRLQCRRR